MKRRKTNQQMLLFGIEQSQRQNQHSMSILLHMQMRGQRSGTRSRVVVGRPSRKIVDAMRNHPFRTPDGPKKFGVYVRNDKGNVVLVRFGDPNLSIKRDQPERLKNFRARHGCDEDPGPKWKAKYWSCKFWEKDSPVSKLLSKGEVTEVVKIDSVEQLAKKHGVSVNKIEKELKMGIKVEMEHTDDPDEAEKIALQHLAEVPDYYTKLLKYVE